MKEAQNNIYVKYLDSVWAVGLGIGQSNEGKIRSSRRTAGLLTITVTYLYEFVSLFRIVV